MAKSKWQMAKFPKRHVLMVKPRFVAQVLEGSKIHTVRPERKRRIEPGDLLDLRQWSNKPYRSKQVKIAEKTCTGIQRVLIYAMGGVNGVLLSRQGNLFLSPSELEQFAKNDGFACFKDLITFFELTHKLPFEGIIIHWAAPVIMRQCSSIGFAE